MSFRTESLKRRYCENNNINDDYSDYNYYSENRRKIRKISGETFIKNEYTIGNKFSVLGNLEFFGDENDIEIPPPIMLIRPNKIPGRNSSVYTDDGDSIFGSEEEDDGRY